LKINLNLTVEIERITQMPGTPGTPATPRTPVTLTPEAKAVVQSGRLVHLTTIGASGAPHITIVWVDMDGEDIIIGKIHPDQKVKNIRRDSRVALSIEAEGSTWGMQHYLVIEGNAVITEGGAPALLHRLAQRYIGPGTDFPPMPNPPEGFIIRITPTKFRGMGNFGAAS
jgi:PPOX class probable F420-dependent enzyme